MDPEKVTEDVLEEEKGKCLEQIGTRYCLRNANNDLFNIGSICHDACSATSKLIKMEVKENKHPNADDKNDSWHTFKSIVQSAQDFVLEHSDLEVPDFVTKIQYFDLFTLIKNLHNKRKNSNFVSIYSK